MGRSVAEMSDVDPSAFLRTEKTQSNDAPLFDAKKWLWVPDETAGFIAGQIKEQKGDNVVLEMTNGSVRAMKGIFQKFPSHLSYCIFIMQQLCLCSLYLYRKLP